MNATLQPQKGNPCINLHRNTTDRLFKLLCVRDHVFSETRACVGDVV